MKGHEFDRAFDTGENIDTHVDWSKARRPNIETRRVNVDFPAWMVASLEREAQGLGVTQQALIKKWIEERLGQKLGRRRFGAQYPMHKWLRTGGGEFTK